MKIKTVTISGADDSVSSEDLKQISEEFPYVEWAILLSASQQGNNRYPSKNWMSKLNNIDKKLNLAGHLCGKWLRNLVDNGDILFIEEIPLWEDFKRIQLNFAKQPTKFSWLCIEQLRKFCWKDKKEFIIQMDGINDRLLNNLLNAGICSSELFDRSGGAGITPDKYPQDIIPGIPLNVYRGYAGGINPDNIKEQLEKINQSLENVSNCLIWIDMESGVRSNNDKQFDLDKVRKCLDIAGKWT